jgi:hypothetical protein
VLQITAIANINQQHQILKINIVRGLELLLIKYMHYPQHVYNFTPHQGKLLKQQGECISSSVVGHKDAAAQTTNLIITEAHLANIKINQSICHQ